MFKNVIVYRIGAGWSAPVAQIEAALQPARFVACGAGQEQSAGWVEPRGAVHGPLVEAIGGQWLLRFMTEAKVLPGSVVTRKAQEQVAQIEASTGRKPGRKEIRQIREDVRQALLPMAFTRQARINVWIDPQASLLLVDAASQGKADEVTSALVKSLDGLALTRLNTKTSPTAAMSEWLTSQEAPAGFSVDRECELKAADESKSVVRYAHHALDIDEVRQHIEAGKLPTRLALTWEGRVSLLLTQDLQIRKIAFLEGVFDGGSPEQEGGFDADAAIATGELRKLMPDLLLALGGEVVPG